MAGRSWFTAQRCTKMSDAKNRLKRLDMKRERTCNGATNLEIRFYMFGKNSDEYADYMNEPVDFRGI